MCVALACRCFYDWFNWVFMEVGLSCWKEMLTVFLGGYLWECWVFTRTCCTVILTKVNGLHTPWPLNLWRQSSTRCSPHRSLHVWAQRVLVDAGLLIFISQRRKGYTFIYLLFFNGFECRLDIHSSYAEVTLQKSATNLVLLLFSLKCVRLATFNFDNWTELTIATNNPS